MPVLISLGLTAIEVVETKRSNFSASEDVSCLFGEAIASIAPYKALAAKANKVPFYVALPSSTFDWKMRDGIKEIPIEKRGSEEVIYMDGLHDGKVEKVLVTPKGSPAVNYGFDVTPAKYITGLITERGICRAKEKDILNLYPEHK